MGSTDQILATLDVLERLHRLPDSVALTTSETAVFLRCSVSALEAMRASGTGPAYMQGGAKGAAGPNQKCLYEKADLLSWQRSLKVQSTNAAAVRKGQLFTSLFDLSQEEAFWIDRLGRVMGMVERATVAQAVARIGTLEIVWMSPVEAAGREWDDMEGHRSSAAEIEKVLLRELQRVWAGVDSTEIGQSVA